MINVVKCLAVLHKVTIVRLQETVSNFAIINEEEPLQQEIQPKRFYGRNIRTYRCDSNRSYRCSLFV